MFFRFMVIHFVCHFAIKRQERRRKKSSKRTTKKKLIQIFIFLSNRERTTIYHKPISYSILSPKFIEFIYLKRKIVVFFISNIFIKNKSRSFFSCVLLYTGKIRVCICGKRRRRKNKYAYTYDYILLVDGTRF